MNVNAQIHLDAALQNRLLSKLRNNLADDAQDVRCFLDGGTLFAHIEPQSGYQTDLKRGGFYIARVNHKNVLTHWKIEHNFTDRSSYAPNTSPPNNDRLAHPQPGQILLMQNTRALWEHDLTEFNRTLINHFTGSVLILGKSDHLADFIANDFVDHGLTIQSPHANALALHGLQQRLCARMDNDWQKVQYQQRLLTLVDGNYALVCCKGDFHGSACLLADLYCLQNGKILKHWDAIQQM